MERTLGERERLDAAIDEELVVVEVLRDNALDQAKHLLDARQLLHVVNGGMGRDVGEGTEVRSQLGKWGNVAHPHPCDDPASTAALVDRKFSDTTPFADASSMPDRTLILQTTPHIRASKLAGDAPCTHGPER